MGRTSGFVAAGGLTALMILGGTPCAMAAPPEPAAAIAAPAAPADQPPPIRAMNDDEKAAAGCVATAAGTTALVYIIGPTEFVLTVVGGLIVPSSSAALFVGLLSTVTSMACGAAAALTPAVLWVWRHVTEPAGPSVAAAATPRRGFARLEAGQDGTEATDPMLGRKPEAAQ